MNGHVQEIKEKMTTLNRYSRAIPIFLFILLCLMLYLIWTLSTRKSLLKPGLLPTVKSVSLPTAKLEADLVILPNEYVLSQSAYCLDGSHPGYYIRLNPSINKWLLHLPSGAWCYNAETCYSRSQSRLGSTKSETSPRMLSGIMSSNNKINPEFSTWNVVEFIYCDGSSFTGNVSEPIVVNGRNLYLKGAVIFNSILDHLLDTTSLSQAEHVLLTGSSAGSLAALIHVDQLKSRLPSTVHTVQAVVDGGLFLDIKSTSGTPQMKNMLKETYEFHNIKDSQVLQNCIKENGYLCFLPEILYKYVTSPTFFLNSYYDWWYGPVALNIRCWMRHSLCSQKEEQVTETVKKAINTMVERITQKANNGAYITSCLCHTVINKVLFYQVQSNNFTPLQALLLWMKNTSQYKQIVEFESYRTSERKCQPSLK